MAQISTTNNQPTVLGGQTAVGIVNAIMARARGGLFGGRGGSSFGGPMSGGIKFGGGDEGWKNWGEPKPSEGNYDQQTTTNLAPQPGRASSDSSDSKENPTPSQNGSGAQAAQDAKDDAEADARPTDPIAASIQNAGEQQTAIPETLDTGDYSGTFTGGEDSTAAMAKGGPVPSYDDGGAIDGPDYDDENQSTPPIQVASSQQGAIPDNSGAAPVAAAPEDNSGAVPVAAGDAQAAPQQQGVGIPTGDNQLPIMAYLHGAGAAARDAVVKAAQAITPGMNQAFGAAGDGAIPENPNQPAPQAPAPDQSPVPKLPADAAATAANVAKTQGEGAANAHLQRMRIEYQHGMALATTALNAGHKDVAAQMATNAYTWLPDGVTASFTPTNGGMVAHIMGADGKAADYPLSDQSFNELIHIGKAGQFDTLLHKGGIGQVAAVLSARDSASPAPAPAAPAAEAAEKPQRSKVVTILPGPNNHGAKPTYQLIGGQAPTASDSLENRAMQRAYGDPGTQAQRAYMDTEQQFEAGLKNKVDVAQEHGKSAATVAGIRAKVSGENNERTNNTRAATNAANNLTRQQIEKMKSADRQALLQQKISQAHDLAVRGDLTNARAALDTAVVAGGGLKSLSPEHQALYNYVVSRINNPGAYSQQGAPAAPQQAAPATTQRPAPQQNNRAALEAEMRRRGLLQ